MIRSSPSWQTWPPAQHHDVFRAGWVRTNVEVLERRIGDALVPALLVHSAAAPAAGPFSNSPYLCCAGSSWPRCRLCTAAERGLSAGRDDADAPHARVWRDQPDRAKSMMRELAAETDGGFCGASLRPPVAQACRPRWYDARGRGCGGWAERRRVKRSRMSMCVSGHRCYCGWYGRAATPLSRQRSGQRRWLAVVPAAAARNGRTINDRQCRISSRRAPLVPAGRGRRVGRGCA